MVNAASLVHSDGVQSKLGNGETMKRVASIFGVLTLGALTATGGLPPQVSGFGSAPAFAMEEAQSRQDQSQARKEMQAGNILSSREIEAKVLPTMRGAEYLGFAYDSTAMAYRLKFLRDGKVVFVDVDARTGRVMRRSQ